MRRQPAGKNRFMPPVAPAKWTGVRDAIDYGSSAPQREPGVGGNASPRAVAAGLPPESEDCLVLNDGLRLVMAASAR